MAHSTASGYQAPEVLPSTNDVVRSLGVDDIPMILDVEQRALPDTLAARFGPGFSTLYYTTLMADERFFCDGYFVEGRLVGFISYTTNVTALLRDALREHLVAYARAIITSVLARPSRLRALFHIGRAMLSAAPPTPFDAHAELLTIALLHEARGAADPGVAKTGGRASVSHALTSVACERLASLGAAAVVVMCRPAEPIANKFVQNQGFVSVGVAWRFGDRANRYIRYLQSSVDRV